MMETPLGMLNAASIASHPKLQGMVMGTNDLAKELQTRHRTDRLPLQTSLGLCACWLQRRMELAIVDGVYNAFKDDEGLKVECEQGRDMGFDGKTLIHPAQIDVTNAAFSPTDRRGGIGPTPDRRVPSGRSRGAGRCCGRWKNRGKPACCNRT